MPEFMDEQSRAKNGCLPHDFAVRKEMAEYHVEMALITLHAAEAVLKKVMEEEDD